MNFTDAPTYWAKLYLSGPIEVAKQVLRQECLREGLCVTIEPTTYIYTGGEESGYVVGLLNYPRFPKPAADIVERAKAIAVELINATYQRSALMMLPSRTVWITREEEPAK